MAERYSSVIFAAVIFLLMAIITQPTPSLSSPDHNPFGFIQRLEGCHAGQNVTGLHELKRYLKRFGYLNENRNRDNDNDDEFNEALEMAIKAYQLNYHLKASGMLDNDTVKQMMKPRCGIPDVMNNSTNHRRPHRHTKSLHGVAHFAFIGGGLRWGKSSLTYRFRSSAQVPSAGNIRSVCARAFQTWQSVSHFTFREVPSTSAADITIGFHRGNHGDRSPFDGRGGVIAHANAPTGGNFHYDADENWSENPRFGEMDLESVAVHEIGHLLGLNHEPRIPGSVMYPEIPSGTMKRSLHEDDIRGIRTLYGLVVDKKAAVDKERSIESGQ